MRKYRYSAIVVLLLTAVTFVVGQSTTPVVSTTGVAWSLGNGTTGQTLISGGAGVTPTFQTPTLYDELGRIAVGRVDFSAEGSENCIVTVGAVTYTEEHTATDVTVGEWDNGGSAGASATNLAAGINGDTRNSGGNSYAAIVKAGTVYITAIAVGTAGNVTVSDDSAQPDANENLIGGAAAAVKQTVTILHTITTEEVDATQVIIPLPFNPVYFSWKIFDSSGAIPATETTYNALVTNAAGAVPAYFTLADNGIVDPTAGDILRLVATD